MDQSNVNPTLSAPSLFQLVHQLLSALTGNLTVLNLLTVALGFSLLDTEHTMSKKKRAAKSTASNTHRFPHRSS